MVRIALLCCLLVGVASAAWSQRDDAVSMRFGTTNGLPNNTVYNIFKAADGLLWFATDRGIATYNGQEFKVYSTQDGLPDNEVFFFEEDRQHRLWMACYNGAPCFYQNGQFHTAANTPFLRNAPRESAIKFIQPNRDGSLTILYQHNRHFSVVRGDAIRTYNIDRQLDRYGSPMFYYIEPLPEGFRVLTQTGELFLNEKLDIIRAVRFQDSDQLLAYTFAHKFNFWVKPGFIVDRNLKPVARLDWDRKDIERIRKIIPYRGEYVVGGSAGLYSRQFKLNANVSSLCEDAFGTLWVGTLSDGAFCYDARARVAALAAVDTGQRIVASHRAGDWTYALTSDGRVLRLLRGYSAQPVTRLRLRNLRPQEVAIHARGDGRWTVCAFQNDSVEVFAGDLFKHAGSRQFARTQYVAKQVLVSDSAAFLRFTNFILALRFTASPARVALSANLWLEHPDNWFLASALQDGAFRFSTSSRQYLETKPGSAVFVAQRNIPPLRWMLTCGTYLVGAKTDNNLYVLNRALGRSWTFVQNCIWLGGCVLDSSRVFLNASCNHRILSLAPGPAGGAPSLRIVDNLFLPQDPDNLIAGRSALLLTKGRDATIVSYQALEQPVPLKPLVYIDRVATSDAVLFPPAATQKIAYSLSYRSSRSVAISCYLVAPVGQQAAMEYSTVRGHNARWAPLKNGVLTLLRPSSGPLTVLVRARTANGVYSDTVRLSLEIGKPVWLTAPFLACTALAALLAVFFTIRFFIRRSALRHQRHVRYLRSEFKATNALMNPHFMFNCLNTAQALVNTGKTLEASQYIAEFSKLVRKNLQLAKDDLVALQEELELVRLYVELEQVRFPAKISFGIQAAPDLDLDAILVPPLSIQPLVENAILHGILPKESGSGSIVVRIAAAADQISIVVDDDGVGLPAEGLAEKVQGRLGIHGVANRFSKLNAFRNVGYGFAISSKGPGRGVLAEIRIPRSLS